MGGFQAPMAFFVSAHFSADQVPEKAMDQISIAFSVLEGAEKRPSAAFPSSLVVAAYVQVRLAPRDFGGLAPGHF